jgi:hypothetical protein
VKLESVPDLFFVVSVFVPGFIYHGVLLKFVPLREHRAKELILLGFFTATAFNYALCSPVIYLLVTGQLFATSPQLQATTWFVIIFFVPIALAIASAFITQRDAFGWLFQLIRLRSINPVPTGWDWIFGRTDPCYVLVTLQGGAQIAGYFGRVSMASSDPDRRDLYLERVYTIPDEGPWQPVERTHGTYITGSQIAFIEFRQ